MAKEKLVVEIDIDTARAMDTFRLFRKAGYTEAAVLGMRIIESVKPGHIAKIRNRLMAQELQEKLLPLIEQLFVNTEPTDSDEAAIRQAVDVLRNHYHISDEDICSALNETTGQNAKNVGEATVNLMAVIYRETTNG